MGLLTSSVPIGLSEHISRVDGSDYPLTKNTVRVGPTICLGGTHVRDPHGFM
jgi:hypothetical protein